MGFTLFMIATVAFFAVKIDRMLVYLNPDNRVKRATPSGHDDLRLNDLANMPNPKRSERLSTRETYGRHPACHT